MFRPAIALAALIACAGCAITPSESASTLHQRVLIVGVSPIRAGALDAFEPILRADVVEGRREAGNISFDMYRPANAGQTSFCSSAGATKPHSIGT